MRKETVLYNDKKYNRYPDSKSRSARIYFTRGRYKKSSILLHRQIWTDHYGDIPPNMVIHHKDGNSSNNTISNLEMMPFRQHAFLHTRSLERRKISAKMMKINSKFSRAWHSTPEGRAFHKRKIIAYWKNPTRYVRICEDCNKSFLAFKSVTRFCTKRCMQRTYRKV